MPDIEKKLEPNQENLNTLEEQKVSAPLEKKRENIPGPEKVVESSSSLEKKAETQVQSTSSVSDDQQDIPDSPLNIRLKEAIDDILEEGLEDIYLDLSEEKQVEFKAKGEEATNKIVKLLSETKVKVRKIVQTIIEWLKIIPGVNKFFIKQTAKIKTDKILAAKEKELLEK